MANREHFNIKWGVKIDKEELDRKWRMHLREQEEADKAQSMALGGSALLVGGGAGGGYIPPSPEYYVQMKFDSANGYPVGDPTSLSEWNTFFDLPAEGAPFTTVEFVSASSIVVLRGNGDPDMVIPASLFNTSLQILEFEEGGKVIGVADSAFYGSSLSSYTSTSTLHIGPSAFDSSNIDTLDVQSCLAIDDYAFRNCSNLAYLQIDVVEQLGDFVFIDCSAIPQIYNDKLLTCGVGCFKGCSSLQSVALQSVLSIGNQAFGDCYNLISVNLPNLEFLGSTTGDDDVFFSVDDPLRENAGLDVYVPLALSTVNGGNPDGDIQYLLSLFSPGIFQPTVYYV
jgi:hypothetical protein